MNLSNFKYLLEAGAHDSDFELLKEMRSVFVLDMCGFTRRIKTYGLIPALRQMHRLHRVVHRHIRQNAGLCVKVDADNVFAVFRQVKHARAAALAIHAELETSAEADPLCASIGIGFGEIFLLEGDFFGLEINQASKFGEDLAKSGETLLTKAAQEQLGEELLNMT